MAKYDCVTKMTTLHSISYHHHPNHRVSKLSCSRFCSHPLHFTMTGDSPLVIEHYSVAHLNSWWLVNSDQGLGWLL